MDDWGPGADPKWLGIAVRMSSDGSNPECASLDGKTCMRVTGGQQKQSAGLHQAPATRCLSCRLQSSCALRLASRMSSLEDEPFQGCPPPQLLQPGSRTLLQEIC